MHQSLVKFSESEASNHMPSLADFTTTMPELKFSVHTGRLIGSIRRECLDHIIDSGEAHLRRIIISYAAYYNSVRTHRSLNKDAPIFRPIQQIGIIRSHPILGGLHHQYVRI